MKQYTHKDRLEGRRKEREVRDKVLEAMLIIQDFCDMSPDMGYAVIVGNHLYEVDSRGYHRKI